MATALKKVGGARTPHPETERQSRDASPREPQRRGEEAVEGVHPCARGGKRGEERLSRDVSVFETAVSAGGGYKADLVVFDLRALQDAATYEAPKRPAHGIRWVLVNGDVVARRGTSTGRRAGTVLRRTGAKGRRP